MNSTPVSAPQAEAPLGWRCLVCAATVEFDAPLQFRCPAATAADGHHLLEVVAPADPYPQADPLADPAGNPFTTMRHRYAWDAFGAAHGLGDGQRHDLATRLNDALLATGVGFASIPMQRNDLLSEALGFSERGGVWIKDETGQVGGSHKSRHLMSTMLALLVAEASASAPWGRNRPPLAIASCGNAAIAAATIARAAQWALHVFVPSSASGVVVDTLVALGASITTCERRDDEPIGDPCMLRARAAITDGLIPFTVQGPDNAWSADGARSLGWEIAPLHLDRMYVQVGGGALGRAICDGLRSAGSPTAVFAVQTQGCAPFAAAWERALAGPAGLATAGQRWEQCMVPWPSPSSLADGILDDETYDWLGLALGISELGGSPVVAAEFDVVRAYELAHSHTAIDASATGTAGLAGLLAARHTIGDDERVGVVFSGIRRAER